MKDSEFQTIPAQLEKIEEATVESGFTMPSERKTGSLLKTLASSKPGGRFVELGTGTGLSTAWILSGMSEDATLDSVENDEDVLKIAHRYLGSDHRLTFHLADAKQFIKQAAPNSFDMVFADAWPGKYNLLDETLALLKMGGLYVIDDMSPQPNWPDGHHKKVADLLETLNQEENLSVCRIEWATGIVICTRTS